MAMKHGKNMELNCIHCSKKSSIHINSVFAKSDKTSLIITSLIFLIGSAVILYYVRDMILNYEISMDTYIFSSTLLIPFFIYYTLNQKDANRVKTLIQPVIQNQITQVPTPVPIAQPVGGNVTRMKRSELPNNIAKLIQ